MSTMTDNFLEYLGSISNEMLSNDAILHKQMKIIDSRFVQFGFTNEQYSKLLSELMAASTQFLNQYATSSTLELLKMEQQQPLLDKQIELASMDLQIKQKDLELKDKELDLKDKELEIKDKELDLMDKNLLKVTAEIALMGAQTQTEGAKESLISEQSQTEGVKQSDISASTGLKNAQTQTEGEQKNLVISQKALVDRQEDGYGDNLVVKAGEFQGNLASFAVNAQAPEAGDAITDFQTTINQMLSRA